MVILGHDLFSVKTWIQNFGSDQGSSLDPGGGRHSLDYSIDGKLSIFERGLGGNLHFLGKIALVSGGAGIHSLQTINVGTLKVG
jgi:hypothetical protein